MAHSLTSIMSRMSDSTAEGEPEHRAAPPAAEPPVEEATEALDGWGVEMAEDAPVALPSVPPAVYDEDHPDTIVPPPSAEGAPKRGRGRPAGARNKPRDLHPNNAPQGAREQGAPSPRVEAIEEDDGEFPPFAAVPQASQAIHIHMEGVEPLKGAVAELAARQERLEDLVMLMAGRIDELAENLKANTTGQAELAAAAGAFPVALQTIVTGLHARFDTVTRDMHADDVHAKIAAAVVAAVKSSAGKRAS